MYPDTVRCHPDRQSLATCVFYPLALSSTRDLACLRGSPSLIPASTRPSPMAAQVRCLRDGVSPSHRRRLHLARMLAIVTWAATVLGERPVTPGSRMKAVACLRDFPRGVLSCGCINDLTTQFVEYFAYAHTRQACRRGGRIDSRKRKTTNFQCQFHPERPRMCRTMLRKGSSRVPKTSL